MATSTFTQLLSFVIEVQCCFTSTDHKDCEGRGATSTFTHLLSSVIEPQGLVIELALSAACI